MINSARRLLMAVAILIGVSSFAFAQGGTQSLSGVVADSGGGVIPGATVVAKNNATGQTFEVISNEAGVFAIPGIAVGTYTVTVTLSGFKTAVLSDVRIITGTPASIKPVLEIGALSETVQVSSRAELVQTQTAAVSSTLIAEQLNEVPLPSRNALYALNLLPGVQFGAGGGPRAAGINGLPNNTVNITIDGVQTGNMLQSTDGFFSMVTPRLDAIEEITITGAVPGAGAGPGSVQVAVRHAVGHQSVRWQRLSLLAPAGIQLELLLQQDQQPAEERSHRAPVRVPPGRSDRDPRALDGRNKAFFFFNYERLYQPSSATRTRSLLRPEAQTGLFGYNVTVAGVQQRRTVNVIDLARTNGQITAFDPTVARLLGEIRSATTTTGTINDTGAGNTLDYVYQAEAQGNQYAPTGRVDFNLTDKHRLSGSYFWQRFTSYSGPAEQRRVEIPRAAQLRHAELLPHDGQRDAALDAVGQHRQRGARRLAVVAQRLLLQHHRRPCSRIRTATRSGFRSAPVRPTTPRPSHGTRRRGAWTTR